MSPEPQVSIIIPTYNRSRWLAQAIESALSQSRVTVEVIVVDDGSSDGLARDVASSYTGVQYRYQVNQGLGAARNAGLRVSGGEFLIFLDDDDWLTPEAACNKIAIFAARPETGVVYSDLYLAQADGTVFGRYYATRPRPLPTGDIYSALLLRNFIPVHAVLWRRSVVEAAGGFPASQGAEDWNLLIRVAERARFEYLDEAQGYYRLHDQNMTLHYERQVNGTALTHRYVAASLRFAELPAARRARTLVSYAWQQWMDGDPVLARELLHRARAASPWHPLPWLAWALTLFGRSPARWAMRLLWRFRTGRQTTSSAFAYFSQRLKG